MVFSHFFAKIFRMKHINRWGLMRNTRPENLSEHTLDVAVLAHALCIIKNQRFGGNLDAGRAALLGMFHDAGEILTGDLPTPIKYYNPKIKEAYKQVESIAADKLVSYLPDDLREHYRPLIKPLEEDPELLRIIKAADKLSALIKCIEEKVQGNQEFNQAYLTLRETLIEMQMPEVNCFLEEFLDSFSLTLDEQQ